jgi:hypothetical protein
MCQTLASKQRTFAVAVTRFVFRQNPELLLGTWSAGCGFGDLGLGGLGHRLSCRPDSTLVITIRGCSSASPRLSD